MAICGSAAITARFVTARKKWQAGYSNSFVAGLIVAFVEDHAAGKIWCATPDTIWELKAVQGWAAVRSGFDQIKQRLACSHDGRSAWYLTAAGASLRAGRVDKNSASKKRPAQRACA